MDFLELEGVAMTQVGGYRQHQLALIFLNFQIIVKRQHCAKNCDMRYHQVLVSSYRNILHAQSVDKAVRKYGRTLLEDF